MRPALRVEPVTEPVDIEASGLLDGLDSDARAERAELIEWLLRDGFSVERIKDEVAPMLLPAGLYVGDDGVRASARQICEETGIDLELLEAIQRALGLPRVEDPDAAVHLRADNEAAARAKVFIDLGLTREQVITVSRVLGQGLAQTAEVMRQVALEAVLQPGATELQIAQAYGVLVQQVSPLLGPLCEDVLRLQLRHRLETEAISAAERKAGVPDQAYVDPTSAVCPDPVCRAVVDGKITYRDDSHLTAGDVATRWRQFAAALRQPSYQARSAVSSTVHWSGRSPVWNHPARGRSHRRRGIRSRSPLSTRSTMSLFEPTTAGIVRPTDLRLSCLRPGGTPGWRTRRR